MALCVSLRVADIVNLLSDGIGVPQPVKPGPTQLALHVSILRFGAQAKPLAK
jgi:hypothetical protein